MELLYIGIIPALSAATVLWLTQRRKERGEEERPEPKTETLPWDDARRDLPDYTRYEMNGRERAGYITLAALFLGGVSYVFYQSIFFSVLLMPLALLYPRYKSRELLAKRKRELSLQFKDALYSLASSVSVGKSLELAFKDAVTDLAILYPDSDAYIIRELTAIVAKTEMNETLENALVDFAQRANLDELTSFTDVFIIGKRSGGNMIGIIRNTSALIAEKLRIKEEIETLLAQRKLERKLLNVMPVGLVLLLTWSTGDYMFPVFHTVPGRLAMSAAIALLGVAYVVSGRIIAIEI